MNFQTLPLAIALPTFLAGCLVAGCGQVQDPVGGRGNPPEVSVPGSDDPLENQDLAVTSHGDDSFTISAPGGKDILFYLPDPEEETIGIEYGSFAVEFEVRRDYDGNLEWTEMREYTDSDELRIHIQPLGQGLNRQTVFLNDHEMTIVHLGRQWARVNGGSTVSPEEAFDQLAAFYLAHQRELFDHEDANALGSFLGKHQETIFQMCNEGRICEACQFLCNLAVACVAIKCWFGALANGVCAACTSAVAACSFMQALGFDVF